MKPGPPGAFGKHENIIIYSPGALESTELISIGKLQKMLRKRGQTESR